MATAFRKSVAKQKWTKPELTKLDGEAADRARRLLQLHNGIIMPAKASRNSRKNG